MEEERIKHLEFIQNIISRMNSKSFQIKEMTVVIVTAILALYVSTKNNYFIILGVLPSLLFWFLDTYYLAQERKFRGLYNDVAGIGENHNKIKLFEMRLSRYIGGKYAYSNVFRSITIVNFYASIVIVLTILYIYFQLN